jgi:hypothetical protein
MLADITNSIPKAKEANAEEKPKVEQMETLTPLQALTTVKLTERGMFTLLLRMAAAPTWNRKLNDKKRGICVFNAKFPGSKAAALKAVTIVPRCAPEVLRDLLLERNAAPQYDSMMESLRLLHDFADDTSLELRWAKYKAVFPTKGRDFVVLTGCVTLADARARGWFQPRADEQERAGEEGITYVIASREADPLVPLLQVQRGAQPEVAKDANADTWAALNKSVCRKECVRGNLRVSGFLLRPYAGGTEVTMLSHAELNGNIPPKIINKFSVNAPAKMLAAIKKLAAAL